MLKYTPAVFAVANEYQIMVPVDKPSLFRVKVGDRYFYDEQNGIMCSLKSVHRVKVPRELLDAAGGYTVCERVLIDRKPYFATSEPETETEFSFHPIPDKDLRIFHISDTHNRIDAPVAAAKRFGHIDLLVMNGDLPNHSGDIANFDSIYAIAEGITKGERPIVFARGNHDMRGYHAEEIADYTPNHRGNTYYTVRIGNIWALVLDCGEDKPDDHAEYGYTVACHAFRERQTEFIREIIENAEREYAAPGVEHKLLICHNPFTYQLKPPFDIEKELYTEWASLIRESIEPELMLCGHLHKTEVAEVGGKYDHLGQPCRLVLGASITRDDFDYFRGCGITLADGDAEIEFVENKELTT